MAVGALGFSVCPGAPDFRYRFLGTRRQDESQTPIRFHHMLDGGVRVGDLQRLERVEGPISLAKERVHFLEVLASNRVLKGEGEKKESIE